MRIAFLLFFVFLFRPAFAQDKTVLANQLLQILNDYTNKFKNLKNPSDTFTLKFKVSGSTDKGFFLGKNSDLISVGLGHPKSSDEAKWLFNKWVSLINQIDFNGVKMNGIPCSNSCGDYVEYSEEWSFDKKRKDLDARYFSFTIKIEVINYLGVYGVSMFIGKNE
ncbi:MAG: hypothetical protein JST23_02560 [Bacteroidetes bacterium]|nr:hypothetical protein [Bacteroidota bacterium]